MCHFHRQPCGWWPASGRFLAKHTHMHACVRGAGVAYRHPIVNYGWYDCWRLFEELSDVELCPQIYVAQLFNELPAINKPTSGSLS
jgi:hypothetical protein